MANKRLSTFTDQVTERLRKGMAAGRWTTSLPGRKKLAEEMGCSPWTIEEAISRLTKEGVLISPGGGHRRQIVKSKLKVKPRALRVMILLYEESDGKFSHMVDLLNRLQNTGHEAIFAEKSMRDLRMDVKRIARFVNQTEADAWIISAGPRDVLQWFSEQSTPAFALFGRNSQTPLASLSLQKPEALVELADRLVELGHRRIVILAREERRKPTPARLEQVFLDRLEERGITTGNYNLPDWGDSPQEFRRLMDSLFKYTPPTALIVDEPAICVALLQHLSRLKISVPDEVSIAATDKSDAFNWCHPEITHITWDSKPVITRVVNWTNQVARGKNKPHRTLIPAELVLGGTTGPAPKSR